MAGKPNKILVLPWDHLRDNPTQDKTRILKTYLSKNRRIRKLFTLLRTADQPARVPEGLSPRYQNDEGAVHNASIDDAMVSVTTKYVRGYMLAKLPTTSPSIYHGRRSSGYMGRRWTFPRTAMLQLRLRLFGGLDARPACFP